MDYNSFENKKRVLVMLSSYNGELFIREQIESILEQKECEIELMVRDDGSNDSTISILKEYERKGKLAWYQGENIKPAQSFLDILFNASTKYDYYAFSDQDDVWDDDKIITAIRALNLEEKEAIYCCNARVVDDELNDHNDITNNFELKPNLAGLLSCGGVQGSTIVMNRVMAKKFIKHEKPTFVKMHDHYVSCVCSAIGGTIIYDKNAHLMYRQHEGNVLGVKRNAITAIRKRINMIFDRRNLHDVVKTAGYILNEYDELIPDDNKRILSVFVNYKDSFRNRIKAMRLDGIGNGRKNIAIAARLSILLGKI